MGIPRLLKIILPNPDQEILGFPVSGGGEEGWTSCEHGYLSEQKVFSAMMRTLQCGRLIHGKSVSLTTQLQ